MRGFVAVIVIIFLVLPESTHAKAGKTASKSGLVAAAKNVRQGQSSSSGTGATAESRSTGSYSRRNRTNTPLQQLKEDIMDGYDATMAPVIHHEQNVNIRVGITYRQVLDLDEKNQVLKSLIWLRLVWNDIHFMWDPADYAGLDELEIPHSLVWMPDIVVYEEIGVRSYAPRLTHVKVRHDGTVQYQEPTSIETSCSIDTAYFPFDVQICRMTFVSWSQPVTHVDLSSDRESWKLSRDTKSYFINTGEWKLAKIGVRKVVRDYGALVNRKAKTLDELQATLMNGTATESPTNATDSPEGTTTQSPITVGPPKVENIMDSPTQQIETMLPGNHTVTESMYAEVIFTLVVRRNSSLYMQSMLFPSIILTTVALLGFYLPPESGERIGLQITILLTFMVFLLAVGEMFPASTGPYLGVYFVICMGLLGVNLAMTVMVLHIHFKPVVNKPEGKRQKTSPKKTRMKRCAVSCCDSDFSGDDESCVKKTKRKKRNGSAIPRHYRKFLQFCDRYWTLGERGSRWMQPLTDDEDDYDDDDVISGYESNSNECTWSDSREIAGTEKVPADLQKNSEEKRERSFSAIPDVKFINETGKDSIEEKQKSASVINLSAPEHLAANHHNNGLNRGKSTGCLEVLNRDARNRSSGSIVSLAAEKKQNQQKYESKSDTERSNVLRHRVLNSITNMKGFTKVAKSDTGKRKKKRCKQKANAKKRRQQEKEDEQERQDLEQEEWKSVARAVDIIFFRIYVIFILASHIGLLGAVFASWNSEDRS